MSKVMVYFRCAPHYKSWQFMIPSSMKLEHVVLFAYKMIAQEVQESYAYSDLLLIFCEEEKRILNPTETIEENQLQDGNTILLV